MAAPTGAVVLLETVALAAHTAAAPHRVGDTPRRGDEGQPLSAGLLVDEREWDRATRVEQRVAAGTGRAGLEITMDRTALRKQTDSTHGHCFR